YRNHLAYYGWPLARRPVVPLTTTVGGFTLLNRRPGDAARARISSQPLPRRGAARSHGPRRARAAVGSGAEELLQDHGAVAGARPGCADAARRHDQRTLLRVEAQPWPPPRGRSPDAHFVPDRNLQSAAHPAQRAARRPVGAPAEQQSDLRGADAARLHDARRPAGDADCAPPARCAPRRLMALPPV